MPQKKKPAPCESGVENLLTPSVFLSLWLLIRTQIDTQNECNEFCGLILEKQNISAFFDWV